ncbi:MAG: hypothetical protein ACLGI5_04045, partial [Thermoleophilia bacterium]
MSRKDVITLVILGAAISTAVAVPLVAEEPPVPAVDSAPTSQLPSTLTAPPSADNVGSSARQQRAVPTAAARRRSAAARRRSAAARSRSAAAR